MKKIYDYQIGDYLYRYVEFGGVFKYKVIGKRAYEIPECTQLEVECQSCNHGYKCCLLLAQDDYKNIISIRMLNESEDDPQKHWHTQEKGLYFHPSPKGAKEDRLYQLKKQAQERVNKAKENLSIQEDRLKEIQSMIDCLNEDN